jgi:hypothetical protein
MLPVLAGAAVARFPATVAWDEPSAWVLAVWAALGAAIFGTERRPAHRERPA